MSKIVISLTTISTRIKTIDKVIDSLLKQVVSKDIEFEVRLYISPEPYMLDEGVTELTPELNKLTEKENFHVESVKNIGSYRKFFYTLEALKSKKLQFDYLVTCDDDTIYPDWWLQTLYDECVKLDCCIAFRGRQITYKDGIQLPYRRWKHTDDSLKEKSYQNVGTGKDGIIYKPSFFHEGVTDLSGVLDNVGHADDLWLKAHAALNFVPTVILEPNLSKSFPETDGSADNSLYNKINRGGGNDKAMFSLENFIRERYGVDINDFFSFNLKGNSTIHKYLMEAL
tara:strand:+ start:4123 stop:4974 length:852 start_codon:yes stop_codon:yes gene_type:complete